MVIILESENYYIKVLKVTKAKFFCDLKDGDIIKFQTSLTPPGRSYRSLYASTIRVINVQTNDHVNKTTNELGNILKCFELTEVI